MTVITLVLLFCGIYLIGSSVKMKSTGEIPKGMINNKINLQRAKDIPGFINHMYPRGIIFGSVITVFSGIIVVNDLGLYEFSTLFMFLLQLGYMIAIIYYAVISVKAQNKYLF